MTPVAPFDRSRLITQPLSGRKHLLSLDDILPLEGPPVDEPSLAETAARIKTAAGNGRSVVLMMGAHVIRAGVQRHIIDLMEKGYVSCLATNGAGVIHDYEFALAGGTTESVAEYITDGRFGFWEETGRINDIVARGAFMGMGVGASVGRAIVEGDFPHRSISLLAAAHRLDIPFTVHVGIGCDIVHQFPNCDGAAWGAASYADFLTFASVLENLGGGVFMNFGSAVTGPEVFLKALSMARNAARQSGGAVADFTTLVCDLRPLGPGFRQPPSREDPEYYFRPRKTLLVRTLSGEGESHYVQGDHAKTVPMLWRALSESPVEADAPPERDLDQAALPTTGQQPPASLADRIRGAVASAPPETSTHSPDEPADPAGLLEKIRNAKAAAPPAPDPVPEPPASPRTAASILDHIRAASSNPAGAASPPPSADSADGGPGDLPEAFGEGAPGPLPERSAGELEKMAEDANRAMQEGDTDTLKAVLPELAAHTADAEQKTRIHHILAGLCLKEGDASGARTWLAEVPLAPDSFARYLSTYAAGPDIDGLLDDMAGYGDVLNAPEFFKVFQSVLDQILQAAAADPGHVDRHQRRYAANLAILKEEDEKAFQAMAEKGFDRDCLASAFSTDRWCCLKSAGDWRVVRMDTADDTYCAEKNVENRLQAVSVQSADVSEAARFLSGLKSPSPQLIKPLIWWVLDFNLLNRCLAVLDFSILPDSDYVYRFVDQADFDPYFREIMATQHVPSPSLQFIFNEEDRVFFKERIVPVVEELKIRFKVAKSACYAELDRYYDETFKYTIPEKIREGRLKLLMLTSRYSTFLQYCAGDLADSFGRIGVSVHLEMEKKGEPPGRRADLLFASMLKDRPDVVMSIDHLRAEKELPGGLPFVTWIQDKMDTVAGGRFLDEIRDTDVLLTQTFYDELLEIGYRDLIRFPVPVNHRIFSGEPGRDGFLHDIGYVNHAPLRDVLLMQDPEENARLNAEIYAVLEDALKDPDSALTFLSDYRQALVTSLEPSGTDDRVYDNIRNTMGNYIARTRVLEWLLDAGFSPALYGRDWDKYERFAPFARGVAAFGKALSEVYNQTRINLHVHPYVTTHQRVFEAIASGGFVLVKRIPLEKDMNPLTLYLDEGDGFVFFDGPEDMKKVINRYLSDEKAREAAVRRGQEKVLVNYTYDKAAEKLLGILSERFSGLRETDAT